MTSTIIIAEAGVNHNGSLDRALAMIDAASEARADYIKFQTFNTGEFVTRKAEKGEYQRKNDIDAGESQYDMLKPLELSPDDHRKLIRHCQATDIKFLSSAFDLPSIDFLKSLGQQTWKIPSGEITNLPYLSKIALYATKVFLSTGMSTLDEIAAATAVFLKAGIHKDSIYLLHCNSEYPTPYKDVNLRAIKYMRDFFQISTGYSDHTLGIEVPIAAVTLGASIIEKHFTLDRDLPGPDHNISLNASELKEMVSAIRNIEEALGNEDKNPTASELKNREMVRKSIHIRSKLPAGDRKSVV